MKPETSTASPRTKKYLVSCLAALMAVSAPMGFAASNDAMSKLQEENAALRKRLAALEGSVAPAPASTTAPAAMAPGASVARAPMQTDAGVETLSAFEVKTDRDFGYLKTNAATATKIGMEIQKIPLNVSVISREFLNDTNAQSLTDLFRYTAAASGDGRFAMRIPANSATPQGTFTMRGFVVNSLMRNGIFRYTSYNLDTVERVEIIKGPASVFFGQGYPGGVINYISKLPQFGRTGGTISLTINDNSGQKVILDQNVAASKKLAMRIVGTWEDTQGERRFEYRRSITANPSLALVPFDSGKLKITMEGEFTKERFSVNDFDWIYSDFAGWQEAATTGRFNSSTATLANTIAANAGNLLAANVVQGTSTPTLAYTTFINNKRIFNPNAEVGV